MRQCLLILAMCGLLAAAVAAQPATTWVDFIVDTYERHDKDLDDHVVGEVDRFMAIYPRHERVPDLLYCKGRTLEQAGHEHRALLCWLQLGLVFPDHEQAGDARDAVLRLAVRAKKYEKHLEALRSAMAAPAAAEPADRRMAFLELTTSIMHKGLRKGALPAYRAFGALYPTDSRQVRTLEWEARILADDGDEHAAAATLAKAEALFPDAPGVPLVMRRRALLLADELKSSDEALAVLDRLRLEYPQHPVAASALRDQAGIKADSKDYPGAVKDLRAFADSYPEDDQTLDVLFELADLLEGKLKAWERADAVYDEVVTRAPNDPRAVEALRASAKLNEKRLKDSERAATQYARVAELFPDADDADKDLFQAAKLAEKELSDPARAITYLETIIRTWPDSEPARKAQKKLDKLQASE